MIRGSPAAIGGFPMQSRRVHFLWCGVFLLVVSSLASAEPPESGTSPDESAATEAAKARADLGEIRSRAKAMPGDQRRSTDKRVAATIERVNKDALSRGQANTASKLAVQFSVSAEALLAEKAEYGFTWGEVVIAHRLQENAAVAIDIASLSHLREEGLSWGAIAYGLRFHLEDLEEVIKSGGKIGR